MDKLIELALIVAGIDEEYQNGIIDGIIACAKERGACISCFSAFGGVISGKGYDLGEYNIYNLINFSLFDGVLLMINTISDPVQKRRIVEKVTSSGLPTVVFDCENYPDFYNITIDNSAAMEEIIRHVITVHGVKRLEYLSGPASNPEANARLSAFRKVCGEYGIPFSSENIHYGEFRPSDGRRAAEKILKRNTPLPEALICANDAMALTVISEFVKHGVRVPEDLIVTGFDNTYYARHHSPSLTTVERPLNQAGRLACDTVVDLIEGKNRPKVQKLAANPVFSESCGCGNPEEIDLLEYKKITYDLVNSCREDIDLLNHLSSELAETDTEAEAMSVISGYLGDMGCEQCCICMCDGWDSACRDGEFLTEGYAEKVHAPLIWDKGEVRFFGNFDSSRMNPIPHDEAGSISFFLPLHFRERCLGYFVATNGTFPAKSMLCHSVLMNISNSLENIRKLINLNTAIRELDRLYLNDPLCGIYNRIGFIRIADEKFRELKCKDRKIVIAFVDMDGLKHINDDFGHNEGDYALQRLASTLSDCCRSGWICARFGGDEFIVFGQAVADNDGDELERAFEKRLAEINKLIAKPYEICASIGTVVTSVSEDDTLFSFINRADEIMYEQKNKKHSPYIRK